MRRYWTLVACVAGVLLLAFVVVEAVGVPLLVDPREALTGRAAAAGLIGIALLVADIALPVPSSVVMVALGAELGPVLGSVCAVFGTAAAGWLAFGVGRVAGPSLLARIPADERARADELLARWGVVALLATRPVPVLAETAALAAGASPMRAGRAAWTVAVGSVPVGVVYAVAGSVGAEASAGALAFGGAVTLALGWVAWRRRSPVDLAAGGPS